MPHNPHRTVLIDEYQGISWRKIGQALGVPVATLIDTHREMNRL
jgi:hypothetical protein